MLRVRDREFAEAFAEALRRIGLRPSIIFRDGRYIVNATSTELYYLLDSGEWRKYMDSDPEARLGFLGGFLDGDGIGLMPAYANTNVELLEYIRQLFAELGIRASPLMLMSKKGSKR
ncbi:hypothetical protein HRbin02_00540 [Candidatus Calditenuaceae archaeon HR02]|nr:hypothetical protein HRbin02_00540 [Candidatus Calditenuaceae archaeon HR02]